MIGRAHPPPEQTRAIRAAIAVAWLLGATTWTCRIHAQAENDEPRQQGAAIQAELEKAANEAPPDGADPQEQCIHLHKRGVANMRLGRYEKGIADLREALALNRSFRSAVNQWCERWRIQVDLERALGASGDQLGRIEQMRLTAIDQRKENARRYMLTLHRLAGTYAGLGMLKEAEEAKRQADDVLPEVRRRRDWSEEADNILGNQAALAAQLLELRGNFTEAERFRRVALNHYLALDNTYRRKYSPSHQLTRSGRMMATSATRRLANNLAAQGKTGEAEYHARFALNRDLSFAAFNTEDVSNALAALTSVKLQQGQLASAQRWAELALKSLEGAEVRPYSPPLADRRWQLGFILGARQRWPDALAAFEKRDAGLRSNAEQFARTGADHLDWAMALLKNGRGDPAVAMLNNLLKRKLKQDYEDPLTIAQLQGYLGVALASRGDDLPALEQFRTALPVLLKQTLEDTANDTGGYVNAYRQRLILETYLEMLARLHRQKKPLAGLDPEAEAFRIAEISRGSAVQRAVTASAARASLPDSQLAELARKEQDTSNQIQSLNKILARLAAAPEAQRLQKVMADMREEILRLEDAQKAQRKELAERFPDYARLVDPQPAGMAAVQGALASQEAAVSIYVGDAQTYVWTLTRERHAFRIVALGRSQLTAQVKRLRAAFDLSDGEIKAFDHATAHQLFEQLLAGDAALWAGATLLNIMPHGPLGQLPFAVLETAAVSGDKPAWDTIPWLIRRVAIAQQPSANSLLALRQAQAASAERKPLIGFGDPLFVSDAGDSTATRRMRVRNLDVLAAPDGTLHALEHLRRDNDPVKPEAAAVSPAPDTLPARALPTLAQAFSLLSPLPDTTQELQEIAQATGADAATEVHLGRRATESKVKSADLSAYRVVAFATHGLMAGELAGLDQPALALSNPALTGDGDNDGFLTLDEILGLKLNADWVILSACNTASAASNDASEDGGGGQEAVSGLGRGFFYAGARSLLVSNWAVETVSARLLTTGLFRHQAADPRLTRAAALRRSMLDVMQAEEAYAHPAFWAPFSLVGDGMR